VRGLCFVECAVKFDFLLARSALAVLLLKSCKRRINRIGSTTKHIPSTSHPRLADVTISAIALTIGVSLSPC